MTVPSRIRSGSTSLGALRPSSAGNQEVDTSTGLGEPALILTYSWDRLIVDPVPGPRSPADFIGLRQLTPHVWAVPGNATLKPPHASTLPRLAAELPHAFALIDPHAGAAGITRQLNELIAHFTPESIDLLDVGGDILAHGDEPTLRSPLADALTLAACARAAKAAVRLLVAGPGLDGEVPADVLGPRLGPLLTTLTPAHARARRDHQLRTPLAPFRSCSSPGRHRPRRPRPMRGTRRRAPRPP
ncbi:DUF1152 domain-containing protein [Streptomyces sp. MZ04]|uniref:DUF1152 domain-containing protein n=1 Tax=Streptomyces sp. MZ04 TaxID=2559236 RepID=UPI0032AF3C29